MEFFLKVSLMGMILSVFLAGCFSAPAKLPDAVTAQAGPNESEIIIERDSNLYGAAVVMNFYIDGELKATLGNGQKTPSIVVPNGRHQINGGNGNAIFDSIIIDADSNRFVFRAQWQGLGAIKITEKSKTALDNPSIKKGIDGAIERAAQALITSLPKDAKIAIISVSSDSKADGEYVVEELTVLLVNAKQYTIVDRKSLDAIRSEQQFQMTGEVDDDSAVSIGQLVGADTVITGAITTESTGDSKRMLRLKALSVKTAVILAMASEKI